MRLKLDHEFVDPIEDQPHTINGKICNMRRVAMLALQTAPCQGESEKRKRAKLIRRIKAENRAEISLGVDEANLIRESIIATMGPTLVDEACDLIDQKDAEPEKKEGE